MSGGYNWKCYPDRKTTLANACAKPKIVYKVGIKRNTKKADHSIYIYINPYIVTGSQKVITWRMQHMLSQQRGRREERNAHFTKSHWLYKSLTEVLISYHAYDSTLFLLNWPL